MPANLLPTIVKNSSGVRKSFPFLPPHGATLDADQTYTVDGDLLSALIQQRPAYATGLAEALNAGDLEIIQSAAAVLTAGDGVAGVALDYDRTVALQNVPSRVVGLFWPGEDVRLGRLTVGQPAETLKDYIVGQPAATPGTFKLKAAGAFSTELEAPTVVADVFGTGEAGLAIGSTNLSVPGSLLATGSQGLRFFPTGYDADLIDGTEYLGFSCLINRPAVVNGSGTSALAIVANGALMSIISSTQNAGSITTIAVPSGVDSDTGAPVALNGTANPVICNLFSGVSANASKHYLLTLAYKPSTDDVIMRVNKTCTNTVTDLSALTGASALSLGAVPGAAIMNYAGFHAYRLGPVAFFRTTDVANDLLAIENYLTDLIPGISLG